MDNTCKQILNKINQTCNGAFSDIFIVKPNKPFYFLLNFSIHKMVLCLLFVICLICAVEMISRYLTTNRRIIPGPRGLPFVGLGPEFAFASSQGK